MPRTCTICSHEKRAQIDKAVLSKRSIREIADRWSVSKTALHRHGKHHVAAALIKGNQAAEATYGDDLLAKVQDLQADAKRIMAKAEKAEDLRTAIIAVRELARLIDLLGRLRGELQNAPPTINVQVLAPVILSALEGFPEARLAVAERLSEIDQKGEFT